jgi:hypothetical protein
MGSEEHNVHGHTTYTSNNQHERKNRRVRLRRRTDADVNLHGNPFKTMLAIESLL